MGGSKWRFGVGYIPGHCISRWCRRRVGTSGRIQCACGFISAALFSGGHSGRRKGWKPGSRLRLGLAQIGTAAAIAEADLLGQVHRPAGVARAAAAVRDTGRHLCSMDSPPPTHFHTKKAREPDSFTLVKGSWICGAWEGQQSAVTSPRGCLATTPMGTWPAGACPSHPNRRPPAPPPLSAPCRRPGTP